VGWRREWSNTLAGVGRDTLTVVEAMVDAMAAVMMVDRYSGGWSEMTGHVEHNRVRRQKSFG